MTTTVPALVVPSAGAQLRPSTVERRDPGETDVVIDIAYCGICHSDIHQGRDDWGRGGLFPMVPGHEIAGTVAAVGPDVTRFAVGDRVGVGCMVDSCRACEPCKAGEEQYCEKGMVSTYNGRTATDEPTFGGYSTRIVVDQNYVLRIPDGLGLDVAAPLLCAGITTYSPLRTWAAGPGKRVAVVGMGGLGHLGVKIAAALGAETVVLSQSLAKEQDGRAFGAHEYYATSDPSTFRSLRKSFDLILNTVSAPLPLDSYLGMLRLDGTMVDVGAAAEPLPVSMFSLIGGRRRLAGSAIGGIEQTQEMLDFCAQHGIGATIETIGAGDVNGAWDRVVASAVRYRYVIDVSTIAS